MGGWIIFLVVYVVVLLGGYYLIRQMARKTRDKYGWADSTYVTPPEVPPANDQPPSPPAGGQ